LHVITQVSLLEIGKCNSHIWNWGPIYSYIDFPDLQVLGY